MEVDFPGCDLVSWVAHDHICEGGFSCTVAPHNHMDFATVDGKV